MCVTGSTDYLTDGLYPYSGQTHDIDGMGGGVNPKHATAESQLSVSALKAGSIRLTKLPLSDLSPK